MGASHKATLRQYPLLNLCAMRSSRNVVVVGHGMVGHRFVEALRSRDDGGQWRVTVVAEEADAAYDRVGLTGYTEHWDRALMGLPGNDYAGDELVELVLKDRVTRINRDKKYVTTMLGRRISYDALVLATGSYAFVPPVPGNDLPSCHVYRTLDDLDAIRADAQRTRDAGHACRRGDRRRSAGPGGRQCAALLRAAPPRRRDGAPADGPTVGRGRRRPARQDDQ